MNSKAAQERQQRILLDLVRQPGNDVCADCKGRAPRWASWNLGIFICVQCAGVHRKMGTHISKVKSITLDTWTREQVERMKQIGNVKSNKAFNPDEMRNRPPTNMEESERDSELEKYIRRKYEFRRFMEGRPPPVPTKDATFLTSPPSSTGRAGPPKSPSQTSSSSRTHDNLADGSSIARSRTAPIPSTWREAQQRAKANAPPLPSPGASAFRAANGSTSNGVPSASGSATQAQSTLKLPTTAVPLRTSSALNATNGSGSAAAASKPMTATAQSSVFDDLISLSDSATPANQPPLQMNPWATLHAQQQAVLSAPAIQEPSGNFWSGQSGASATGTSASLFGLSPSNNASTFNQLRTMPQHANTAPPSSLASQQTQMNPQTTGMLSPSNGLVYPQYQQQRSVSLGTMAFSPPSLTSPGLNRSNPFSTMQTSFASSLPQTTGFAGGAYQQQLQQLGHVAFQGQAGANMLNSNANFISPQPPSLEMQPAVGAMGQFQSSMMPNGYGQSTQFGGPFVQQQQAQQQQQQQQQQQHTQLGSQPGNMW